MDIMAPTRRITAAATSPHTGTDTDTAPAKASNVAVATTEVAVNVAIDPTRTIAAAPTNEPNCPLGPPKSPVYVFPATWKGWLLVFNPLITSPTNITAPPTAPT